MAKSKTKESEGSKVLYAVYILALTGVLSVAGLIFTNSPPEFTFLGLLILMQVIAQAINTVYAVHVNED